MKVIDYERKNVIRKKSTSRAVLFSARPKLDIQILMVQLYDGCHHEIKVKDAQYL